MISSLQGIKFKNTIYAFLGVPIILICLFVLVGCISHSPAKLSSDITLTKIISDFSHRTVQQNTANTIKITAKASTNYWHENTQFSLMPAGPYISHVQPLSFHPLAIVSDGRLAFVATRSSKKNHSNLLIIQFTADGQSKIIGGKLLIKGVITKLTYKNKQLIFTLKQGGINVMDVSNPTSPVTILSYPTKSTVLDIQQGKQTVHLLLKNNILIEVNIALGNTDKSFGKLLHKWKLPVPANAIAVRNKIVYLAGSEGIASVKITSTTAKLIALHKTSGIPKNIQLIGDLAVVTDGPGGLVVFRTDDNGRLQWLSSYNKRDAISSISTSPTLKEANKRITALVTLSNGNILSIDLTNPELPASGVMFKPEQPALAATLFNVPGNPSRHSDALLVTKDLLLRVNMTGNNKQLISSEGVNQGGSRRGVIRDNILYVADWFSGLHLYDISNPKQLKHLSNYHTPGSSKGVALLNHYALIGDDDQGLQIINIKNPLKPEWVSELAPESLSGVGLAYTMKLVKNTLYLADHRGGFHIIDLSDIKHPKRLGGYNTPGKSWGIDIYKNFVLVADDTSGLLIFDASDVSSPKLAGHFSPGGQAEDVLIKDNLAYVTFFDKGLYILDIRHPHKPKVIGHISIPGNARGLALDKNLAYIAGWESGLHIVDISKPATPHIIGSYDTNGAAWGVNIKDGIAYVLDWWGGLKVIDVQQPSNPVYLSQYHARGTLQQMRSKNKYLFTASGSGGLQVFDIKNPLNPIWATGVDLNGNAVDISLDEDRAYVATNKNSIVILDTLDPFYTRRIGLVNTTGQALRVRAWNQILFIQDSLLGLVIVDVRDSQNPQEIAHFPMQINDLWVDEQSLWVSTAQGLVWWNHENSGVLVTSEVNKLPNKLTNKNMQTISGGTNWVRSQNDLVITADKDGVVKLWRKAPEGLIPLSQYKTRESLLDLQLEQDTLYALGERSGLMAININDPKTPRLTAIYPATGKHTRFVITQNQNQSAAFFAGETRLASVTLLPLITTYTSGPNEIKIHLPAGLPIGQYHLLATTPDGQRELLPNAITVQFSAPGQDKSSLKTMRQMLKNPLKPPTEH